MVLLRLLAFKPKQQQGGGAAEPSKKPDRPQQHPPPAVQDAAPTSTPSTVSIPVRQQAEPPAISKTELPAATKVAPAATSLQPLETTALGDIWFSHVKQLLASESVAGLTRELALQSQLVNQSVHQSVNQSGEAWTLQVDNAMLANPANLEKLQAAFQSLVADIVLTVQPGPVVDTAAKRFAHAATELQAAAESLVLNDPMVVQLMREFDGKIVTGSIKPIKIHL
jgi:DNA polymerase-3 subunit gamma/tau